MSENIIAVFTALAIVVFICLLLAVPTFFLWNWLMPELFGLKMITFMQAVGINFLSSILFKGNSTSTSKND